MVLPFELLAAVLIHVVRDAHWDLEHRASPARRTIPLELASVCAIWRDIALATPQVWSYINFDLDWLMPYDRAGQSKSYSDYLRMSLGKSASLPLQVRIGGGYRLFDGTSWQELVPIITARVAVLEIDCGPNQYTSGCLTFRDKCGVLACLTSNNQMPLLRTLNARILDRNNAAFQVLQDDMQQVLLPHAPNLRHIRIDGLPPAVLSSTVWRNLETFNCNCRTRRLNMNVNEIVRLSPKLEELYVSPHDGYALTTVSLPHIRRIGGSVFRMVQLLQRDSFPEINELDFVDDTSFPSDVRAFFSDASYSSITRLGMPTPRAENSNAHDVCQYLDMLPFLPNVVRVDLVLAPLSQKLFERWAQDEYVVHLPKLVHLRILPDARCLAGCLAGLEALCSSRHARSSPTISSSDAWTVDWNICGLLTEQVEAVKAVACILSDVVHTVRLVRMCPMDKNQYDVALIIAV
ncbi:hypothetical protein BKA62DRAFT_775647 [Auriculariales sp. MPI-PUGE-AT-0066]|nr:hypothetical protein BKA62DRAFT_775647 [Auriculariales sp. MPI-PUGE-AT-0066]